MKCMDHAVNFLRFSKCSLRQSYRVEVTPSVCEDLSHNQIKDSLTQRKNGEVGASYLELADRLQNCGA